VERDKQRLGLVAGDLKLDEVTRDLAIDVLLDGPISRADLARRHSLTPGTVTRLVAPLLKAGLLIEAEAADSLPPGKLGRPSKPLSFVADTHHFVGFKLTGECLSGVLVDSSANVLRRAEAPLPNRGTATVIDHIERLVHDLSGDVEPSAIGIGLGGSVIDDNIVRRAPFLDWLDVPLGAMVTGRLGVPTVVANDVAGLTEAEHWFGAGHGLSSFAVVTMGIGVGYGLVSHGQIVQSPDYGVGLVGHMRLDPAGPRCPEGHTGCADAMLTDGAVAASVSAGVGRLVTFDEAMDLALGGNPVASAVVMSSGQALGKLVALIANIAMPQRIIITGEAVKLAQLAIREVAHSVQQEREPLADEVDYVIEPADTFDWARGAAVIALQRFMLG